MSDLPDPSNQPVTRGDLALVSIQVATALTQVQLALMHLHARRTNEFAEALDEIGAFAKSLNAGARQMLGGSSLE